MSKDINHRGFEQYKAEIYQIFGQHPRNLFNFFYENNDIFKQISEEDMKDLTKMHINLQLRRARYFYGSLFSVLLLDQVVFRFAFPTLRINRFRIPLNLFKYMAPPLLAYRYVDVYGTNDVDEVFERNMEKYNFNYEDYTRVMKILERAFNAGRMPELLKKRDTFDWSGVPE